MGEAATTFVIRLAGAAVALVLQVMLARLMTAGDYGTYVVLWSVLLTCGSFLSLGLAETAVRLLPRYEHRQRRAEVFRFFTFGLKATLYFSAGVSVIVGSFLSFTETALPAVPLAIGLTCLAIEFYLEGIARALGWFRLTSVAFFILQPIAIAAAALALHVAGTPMTAQAVSSVLVAVLALVSITLCLIISWRIPGPAHGNRSGRGPERAWLSNSLPTLAASALDDAVAHGDVVIVGLLMGPASAAVYFAITRIMVLANFAIYAVQFVSARTFSLSLARLTPDNARKELFKASAASVIGSGLALLATTAVSPLLLQIFGPDFEAGYLPTALLAGAVLARSAGVQSAEFLLVSGRMRVLIISHLLALSTLVALSVVAVPVYGLAGAAFSILAANIGRSAMQLAATGVAARLYHCFRLGSAIAADRQ